MTLVDASVVIAVLYQDDAHHSAAVAAVRAEGEERRSLAVSAVTWSEVLTGLHIRGRQADLEIVARLAEEKVTVLPVDRRAAERAAELRADHHRRRRGRLATPDAIVLGTADSDPRIDRVITADSQWRSVRLDDVEVEVLRKRS